MALTLISPENSFIQFYAIDGDGIETCNQIIQKCLPIHYGYDFQFQVYAEGEILTTERIGYKVRIVDGDGNVISDPESFSWFYDDVADRTWGNFLNPFDIAALAALGNGACANFEIFQQRLVYNYVIASWGSDDITIEINIDGVVYPAGGITGGFGASSMDDLAVAINFCIATNFPGTAVAFHTTAFGLQIQDSGGHVYGRITITNGVSSFYDPTVSNGAVVPYYISNCLQYIEDTCWTTVVKYKGNENQFGFNYELDSAFYNSARLRLYYDNPQPVFDENYFVLSNGAKKVLSARYEKEYQCHVDFADEQRHFSLAAAIKHDTVLMGRVTATEEFSCEGKYDIAWLNKPGTNFDAAQASFTMRPTPFFEQNSNCANP